MKIVLPGLLDGVEPVQSKNEKQKRQNVFAVNRLESYSLLKHIYS